jgi:hypothetical protein
MPAPLSEITSQIDVPSGTVNDQYNEKDSMAGQSLPATAVELIAKFCPLLIFIPSRSRL